MKIKMNEKTKKLAMLLVSGTIMVSGFTPAFANSNINSDALMLNKAEQDIVIYDYDENIEMPSFKEFMSEFPDDMKKDIKNDNIEKLESLYNKAVKLDKKENYDESDKLWDEFDKILGMDFEVPSFKEFINEFPDDMKKDIKSDDMKKLEALYNKAINLEEQENYDESDKVWDEFDKLLEMDFEVLSFEEFIKEFPDDMKKDIKNDDMKKLEALYNKAINLEEQENYDESDKLWDEFDKILGMDFEMPSFEEFMKDMPDDMKKDIKNDDMKKLESLYNKAIKLDEKENYDESAKVWDEFDKLLEMNFEMPSFEEFMKDMPDDMKKDIKNDDMKKLESLYNKAVKLDEKENYDESAKVWDEFGKLLGIDFEEEDK